MFYHLYPRWKSFFQKTGVEIQISSETDPAMLRRGVAASVCEACLPVKAYYGHVQALADADVDALFIPRLVQYEARNYICPKLMGLPDMIRAFQRDIPPVLSPVVDRTRGLAFEKREIEHLADVLGGSRRRFVRAWQDSLSALSTFESETHREGLTAGQWIEREEGRSIGSTEPHPLQIGLLGHSYVVNDRVLNFGTPQRLRSMGVHVVTAEMLGPAAKDAGRFALPKRLFWTSGANASGAAHLMNRNPQIDGMIYISCFGCGPDSIIVDTLRRRMTKPFFHLTVDEHSGEAGLETRLEAFIDLIRRQTHHESDFSPSGECLYPPAIVADGPAFPCDPATSMQPANP